MEGSASPLELGFWSSDMNLREDDHVVMSVGEGRERERTNYKSGLIKEAGETVSYAYFI
jgi:hypothetical protein